MNPPSPKKLEAKATAFNNANPIGTPVIRFKLMNPLRFGEPTKTRSAAWVMGGHSVMVLVDGVSGGVAIESVVPIRDT